MQQRMERLARGWVWGLVLVLGVAACGAEEPTGVKEEPPIDMVEVETADAFTRAPQCDSLKVEARYFPVATLFARGDQVYRWDGTAWVFVEPVADLYLNRFSRPTVGTHYAGPSWETHRGSKVTGAVMKRCPADPKSIPWLLLRATSNSERGVFSKVEFIQRLNTVGGLAPAEAGTTVGEIRRVAYTADYRFYRAW